MKNPKRKGKRLENAVAEILNKSFNDYRFARSSTSGLRFDLDIGDISIKRQDEFKILPYIECKNRESWQCKHIFNFEKSPLYKFYLETENKLEKFKTKLNEYKKKYNMNPRFEIILPILVFSKAYENIYAIVQLQYIQSYEKFVADLINGTQFHAILRHAEKKFIMINFEEFAKIFKKHAV